MCNTNGTTIGVQREQLSAVETNYFHFIDLARLKLLSYSELRKKKTSYCCFIFATLMSQASQLLSLLRASKLSMIYFKMSSLKCLATWGQRPSRSATDTVGRLLLELKQNNQEESVTGTMKTY